MYEGIWFMITSLGDPRLWLGIVIGLTLLYLSLKHGYVKDKRLLKRKKLIKSFLLLIIPTLLISFAGSEVLKVVFQIPRPCTPCPAPGCNPYCLSSFSFPSAHTSTMTGIATAMFLLLRKRKYLLVYTFPALIAASRVALDVHTIPDVIGGFFVGLLLTLLVWKYRKRIYRWEDETILS
jgi:membrane-associated phospholipid phosphatase